VYVSEDESLKVFTLVPGARLVGTAAPNTTVTVSTTQSVTGTEFTYSRTADTNGAGEYAVTVPYAGQYEVNGRQVQVSTTAVWGNQTVTVSS
jgi:dolichyl-diphosphooligosaccharide--protein glycosyltransferase